MNSGKINCTSNNQDDTGQTSNDQSEDDCQSWLVPFLPVAPFLSIKALAPLVAGEGVSAFGQMSTTLTTQLLASETKQTFLSTNVACL